MVDFLIQEMDKSIGEVYFKDNRVNLGIKYFEKYLSEIEELKKQNPGNDELIREFADAKSKYCYHLFENAKIAYNEKHWIKSLTCCQKLLEYDFKDTSVYKYTSLIYKTLEQPDIRLKFARKYYELEKEDPDINRFMGEAYFESKDDSNMQTAIDFYHKHLELFPNDSHCYNTIGHIYASSVSLQNTQKQLEYFLKAYEIAPSERVIIKNLILTYSKLHQKEKSFELYEKLKEIGMTNDDYFDYAALCIKHGDFKNGFKYYSHRFKKETDPTFYPKIKQKMWNGKESIQNKILLIHVEQGFGDFIMFSRFIPMMKKYAKDIMAVVQDELLPLMQFSFPDIPFFGVHNTDLEKLNFDYHIPIMELPKIINLTPENIPSKGGYLSVGNDYVNEYKGKYLRDEKFDGKFKIAISFEGDKGARSQGRDVDVQYFVPITKLKNVQVFAFNKDRDNSFYKQLGEDVNIINLADSFNDFRDTAAALMNMDLVISSDNVILNLAGALGLRTFGLFNENYEYRWFDLPNSTGWYTSIKPFVAKRQFQWEEVIDRICKEISTLH